MRASKETYEQVAKRCSEYAHTKGGNCFCNADDRTVSCLTCKHFAADEHCELDLYDPIVANMK